MPRCAGVSVGTAGFPQGMAGTRERERRIYVVQNNSMPFVISP